MSSTSPSQRPRRSMKAKALNELFNWEESPKHFVIPQLIPAGTTLLVNVAPEVDPSIFGQLLAYCAAGRKVFLAFGVAAKSNVLYFSSKSDPIADVKRINLICARDPFESSRKRAMKNLCMYNRHHAGDTPSYLNSSFDQDQFSRLIEPGTNLIVFDNVAAWTKYGKAFDSVESSDALSFLERLNADGISVVLINHSLKQDSPLTATLMRGDADNVITLTYDTGAPHEFGGGFNVMRRKRDDDDTTPRKFQFWWKVVKGQLDFGWELRDQLDPKAAKAMQMIERQMQVDQLLSENKSQREIASLLEVDAATISRDVAKLKKVANKSDSQEPQTDRDWP